ncbi:MAG: helix-turn-helix transcriptional regulator [Actinobacteria bacterium]|nr:helix-turn-helix transcriptional regulator [Actinomycetota bacterium]MBW3651033.1 helix-turn-helix transcriptional regulator [Actinomycetota bacterium]
MGRSAVESADRRAAASAVYRQRRAAGARFADIAWLVIEHRSKKNLSQQELAVRAGTTPSHISRIERGRHAPDLGVLSRIATALDARLVIGFSAPRAEASPRKAE